MFGRTDIRMARISLTAMEKLRWKTARDGERPE
jgi:hypothetical protein